MEQKAKIILPLNNIPEDKSIIAQTRKKIVAIGSCIPLSLLLIYGFNWSLFYHVLLGAWLSTTFLTRLRIERKRNANGSRGSGYLQASMIILEMYNTKALNLGNLTLHVLATKVQVFSIWFCVALVMTLLMQSLV